MSVVGTNKDTYHYALNLLTSSYACPAHLFIRHIEKVTANQLNSHPT